MENQFLQEALRLADLGFKILPIRPGDKRPAVEHGVHDASSDPEVLEKWWHDMPRANLAISCESLVVIDIDDPKTQWPEDDTKTNDLSTCPLQRTPRGGDHRIMLLGKDQSFSNSVGKLARGIDVRSTGGYILVAPSRIGGKEYRWIQGIESREEIPFLFEWLATELERIKITGGYGKSLGSRQIVDGTQNNALTSIGGGLRLAGFSQGEIEATLLRVSAERCVDKEGNSYPHPEERVKKIAWSVARYEPDVFATAAMEEGPPEGEEPEEFPDPGRFPLELIDQVGGLMREVIDFTLKTSPRPQPIFALAGALAMMSTITGHKIRDDQNLRTNLMLIAAGKSGSGKDRARQVNREILTQIGAEKLLGSEEIQSGNGVYTTARTQPVCLLQLDEIGKMLTRIKESRSDSLANVTSTLMKLYSAAGGPCKIGGYADEKRNFMLEQPHVVVLGTTVVESFAASLSAEQLKDGFMGRTLLFHSEKFPPQIRALTRPLPDSIITQAREWLDYQPSTGNLAAIHPEPLLVPYTTEALAAIKEFEGYCDALTVNSHELWSRAAEKMKKCAMNLQASIDGPPVAGVGGILGGIRVVGVEAIRWASILVEYQTRETLWLASQWVADTLIESHTKRVLRWLRSRHRAVTLNEFTRSNQFLSKKMRAEVLETLVQSGQLVVQKDGKKTKLTTRK